MARAGVDWSKRELHVWAELRAPLRFVFDWCTDFDSSDPRRENEDYERRILERTARRVVFEDLADTPGGWQWSRHVVTLHPPDHWHSESVGTHRHASLDYVLTPLSADRTRLDLRWHRRPTALAGAQRSPAAIERESTAAWRTLARSLEQDYRRSRTKPRR